EHGFGRSKATPQAETVVGSKNWDERALAERMQWWAANTCRLHRACDYRARGAPSRRSGPWLSVYSVQLATPAANGRPCVGESLLHPASLLAITILLLNDHVLKAHYSSWLTEKLSDCAGLVFFPLLLATLTMTRAHQHGTSTRLGSSQREPNSKFWRRTGELAPHAAVIGAEAGKEIRK
ncbi:MAG TPA: hypothetical protein VKP30_31280, partial [Polyangiaceae bacterium]|nr:hypothetical protein [Polyangiaceae bacterium]